jgi:hypothetical protein
MFTHSTYTTGELISIREALGHALDQRSTVLGVFRIETVGSVSMGAETPNDIDVRVSISASLMKPEVRAAAEEAVSSVIRTHCFDNLNARLVGKSKVWQWPLDVGISDGSWRLWLKAVDPVKIDIGFMLVPA